MLCVYHGQADGTIRAKPNGVAAPIVICCAIATLFPTPAVAWNALGHKVVDEIAWQQLAPPARQEIVDAIRRHPRFADDFARMMPADVEGADKATQDRWVFQHAGTWPDIARNIRGDERQLYNRPQWHYVNFPLFLDASDREQLTPRLTVNISAEYPTNIDREDYNVMQAIQHSQAAIKSDRADMATKALAYCWLFHLVGDCHQPLHSTALFSVDQFPTGDRGGNEIPLTRGRNLHSLWDNLLGRRHRLNDVRRFAAELSDRERYGDVWESAGKETDVQTWLAESHDLAKSFVYNPAILQAVRTTPAGAEMAPMTPDDAYLKAAGEHARQRIAAAGLRLGVVLDSLTTEREPTRYQRPAVPLPVSSFAPPTSQSTIELTHWLNTESNVRHNRSCRWYGKTKAGRKCAADEGEPCRVCGG